MTPPRKRADHPKPTPATVRELYAHAFSCAYPDCNEWLYRPDPGSAKPILNSRVAHIHARSPEGPRWLPGMTPEENRSAENLLLLCIPHSYEIDEHAARFPAKTLQEWRNTQLQKFLTHRQAWTLDDDQTSEVARESFGSPSITAPVLTSVVRAAERLAVRALATRAGPAAAAAEWRATRERTQSSFFAWDDQGNLLYPEPSRIDTDRHRATIKHALAAAHAELSPLSEDVLAEIAAARHVSVRSDPWCLWLTTATEELLAAASVWPWVPPFEDDERLTDAAADVRRASSALAAALRGETPEPVPPAPAPTPDTAPASDDAAKMLDRHLELLDRARPWARVKTRPYEAALRAELAEATEVVAAVPPVLGTAAFGLDATAALAAAVARNATDDEVRALIDEDRGRRPLVVAAELLVEMWRVMKDQDRGELASLAQAGFVELLRTYDWAAEGAWTGNEVCGARIFNAWSHFVSVDAPKRSLSDALDSASDLLDHVVLGCAPWVQHESILDGSTTWERSYRTLPQWFPTESVAGAATLQYPHVSATSSPYDDSAADGVPEVEHLLGHILRLAE